jgi:tetratricopeptide (TPR) repeat protein
MDPVRFRAPEAFNEIIHELGKKHSAPVVPMKPVFANASPNGLIGNNIMLEHVHPTFEGYFLMADAFYNTMRQNNFISDEWPEIPPEAVSSYMEKWGYTRLDSLYGAFAILKLKNQWPFTTVSGHHDTLGKFVPQTKLDSLAIAPYRQPGYSLQLAHLDLAEYYEQKGESGLALDEYLALIHSIPSMDLFYEDAVRILMQTEQHERARQLLSEALKYNKSSYIYNWLGQTNLLLDRRKDGIFYLNQAFAIDPADKQVSYNLARAYLDAFEFNKCDEFLARYTQLSPNDPATEKLEAYRESLKQKFIMVTGLLNSAKAGLKKKKFKKAAVAVKRSMKIHETALANELMGILKMQSRKTGEAVDFLERARHMEINERPGLLYHSCIVYLKNSQPEEAAQIFAELQSTFPDFEQLDKLETLMNQGAPRE